MFLFALIRLSNYFLDIFHVLEEVDKWNLSFIEGTDNAIQYSDMFLYLNWYLIIPTDLCQFLMQMLWILTEHVDIGSDLITINGYGILWSTQLTQQSSLFLWVDYGFIESESGGGEVLVLTFVLKVFHEVFVFVDRSYPCQLDEVLG